MKFLADMPVSPRTVDFLRRKGHDAIHLRERGMQKATDEEFIKLAGREGRAILTMDLDFPHLMALGRLALDPDARCRMGQAARRKFLEGQFSPESMVAQTLAVYRQVAPLAN